jgi:cytochrome c oxidase subunit I
MEFITRYEPSPRAPSSAFPSRRRNEGLRSDPLGALHLAIAGVSLMLGTLLALLSQMVSLVPRGERWEQPLIALHGLVMVFLCWVPGLSFSLAPFQRPTLHSPLARMGRSVSCAVYVAGAVALLISAFVGGARHGFRYYLGYFEGNSASVLGIAWGIGLVALAMGINGMLWVGYGKRAKLGKCATPYTDLLRVTGGVHVLATPLALALPLLMTAERRWGYGIFDPRLGGDPSLLPSLFWSYLQPVTLAASLPILGLCAELLGKPTGTEGTAGVVVSETQAVAIATLCFLNWGARAEVPLGEVTRNFFVFTGLLCLLVIGRPIASTIGALGRARATGSCRLRSAVLLVALALGILFAVPLVLPASAMRLSATPYSVGQFHWLGFGAAIGAWSLSVISLISIQNRSKAVRIAALLFGSAAVFIAELVAGVQGRPPIRAVLVGGVVCSAVGLLMLTSSLPAIIRGDRPGLVSDERFPPGTVEGSLPAEVEVVAEESVAS